MLVKGIEEMKRLWGMYGVKVRNMERLMVVDFARRWK